MAMLNNQSDYIYIFNPQQPWKGPRCRFLFCLPWRSQLFPASAQAAGYIRVMIASFKSNYVFLWILKVIPLWIHEILHNASTWKQKTNWMVSSQHRTLLTWCTQRGSLMQLGSPRNAKCSSPLQAGNGFPWTQKWLKSMNVTVKAINYTLW